MSGEAGLCVMWVYERMCVLTCTVLTGVWGWYLFLYMFVFVCLFKCLCAPMDVWLVWLVCMYVYMCIQD